MLEFLKKRREPKVMELPPLFQDESPVNYDSVLDWLLGLSKPDYDKMIKVVENYREAKKTEAKILKVKDEATTQLLSHKLTDDEIDDGLDTALAAEPEDLTAAFLDDAPVVPETTTNKRVAKSKKIDVQD